MVANLDLVAPFGGGGILKWRKEKGAAPHLVVVTLRVFIKEE